MAAKLGEMLVEEGLIDGPRLEEALRCQVIFGGRLGTNLLEMGALTEEDLTAFLSRKTGVPAAAPEQFEALTPQLIRLLTTRLAEAHQAVPLELNGRRLTLAMADPSDLAAIDDIAFRTGLVIRPVVAPEVRIVLALERYYQVPRRVRYIQAPGHATPKASASSPRPVPQPQRDAWPADRSPEPTPAENDIVDLEEEITAAIGQRLLSLEGFGRRLVAAADRQDIADALIRYLGQHFRCSCLFLARGDNAMGWFGINDGQPVADLAEFEVPLDEPSFLKTVVDSRSYYLGPVPRSPFNSMILQKIAGEIPDVVLAVPLLMMGRVMAVLYVHGCEGDLSRRVVELQALIGKTVMAFEILVLKNKILSV